jgi:hypothetical protein
MTRRDDEAGRVGRAIGEEISRAIEGHTPGPAVVPPEVELAMVKRCETCQKPGGPIHDLAEQVRQVVGVLNQQRGALRLAVYASPVMGILVGALLAGFVQYKFSQFERLQAAARANHSSMMADVPHVAQVRP